MANVTLDPSQAFDRAFAAYRAGRFGETEEICRRIVGAKSDFFDALHLLAVVQMAAGRNDQALANFDRALKLRPDHADALDNRGSALKRLRRRDEALASFERAIAVRPNHARALFNRAVTLHELRRLEDALASYDRALLAQPENIEAHNNRGVALHELKRFDEALAAYDCALVAKPDYAEAHNNRGATLHALNRPADALASYDSAIEARPDYADALNNRGNMLKEMKRYEEALTSFDRALSARSNYVDALNNRGLTVYELQRYEEALKNFDHALSIQPDNAEIRNNRGIALFALKRLDEAVTTFDRAIADRPDYPEALNNRGIALGEMDRPDEALASYDRAIAARPDYVQALDNRGGVLVDRARLEEALSTYERALAIEPDDSFALSGAASCAAKLCDWAKRASLGRLLPSHIADAKGFIAPFFLLGYSDDPALQLQCAKNYTANKFPSPPAPIWTGETWCHDRLRVAYLSADFRSHPMGNLVADLFETHDRARFEIVGFSYGNDDGSAIRKRIIAAFDAFHDVRAMTNTRTARLLHELEIDIAIDLQGYTRKERPGIFARRPAPIQATYLGYPGTMGASFMDYVIADKIVAPFEDRRFYSENIVHLPDCYMVSDRQRRIAARTPTRREMGLPEHGFVFCCFNNNWKIGPAMFDIWMRLLHQVDGSVLWLIGDADGARRNLGREAEQRGIDRSRLVFADRLPADRHLARHRLADLFLDTLPYNAHSTANDALRAGLPVLTCMGKTFAARVAASHLHAVGLSELIVSDLVEYEALAQKLARDPGMLADVKAKLQRNPKTHPLLDTERFTRGIEAAYKTMWEIWQRGEAPRSFAVASNGNGTGQSAVKPSP